jgi:protein gp37
MGHVRARLFWLIHETPWLDWLLLTKRPENIDMMFNPATTLSENVWIGTTIENQSVAWRADELRKWRAKVRFLSCEPLLGALELDLLGIDWVIAGGESGPNARPSQPSWFRSLRDQCQATKTPYFFKQWGEHAPRNAGINDPCDSMGEGIVMARVGNKSAGCLLDGREWKEFPQ